MFLEEYLTLQEFMKFGVACLCAVAVFSYFLIVKVIKNINRKTKLIEKAKKEGSVTEGVAISSKYSRGSRKSDGSPSEPWSIVTYEYKVSGKEYYTKVKYYGYAWQSIVTNYPQRIAVYYDRDNPKKATTVKAADMKIGGCALTFVMTLVTFFAVLYLLVLL